MNKLEEEKQELDKRLLYQERELQNRIDKLERDKLRLENQLISVALDSQRQLTTQVEKLSRIFFHHSHYYERNLIRDTSFATGDSVLGKNGITKTVHLTAPSSSASASSSSPPSLLKKGIRLTESLCQVTLERCDLREADFRWAA
ncbi:Myosin-11 Myosin heavy chain 11 [Balamuthia mandrillaris]